MVFAGAGQEGKVQTRTANRKALLFGQPEGCYSIERSYQRMITPQKCVTWRPPSCVKWGISERENSQALVQRCCGLKRDPSRGEKRLALAKP